MAFLFHKFQEGVKKLAKSSTFARDPRSLQFEVDVNRLFLYTSYNRLGRDAEEGDAEEIIDLASKASLADQQKQVQENIHSQIKTFCSYMDDILFSEIKKSNESLEPMPQTNAVPRRSGLSFAVGKSGLSDSHSVIPETKGLKRTKVSHILKEKMGYTLSIKPSLISHKDAGQGLFIDGEADVGSVIAFYPGVVFSPAYYRYIPGYPRVDTHNPYLITRYDGTVINAQPWGSGAETREIWDGSTQPELNYNPEGPEKGSDRFWKMLSKPLKTVPNQNLGGNILDRRNPLALAHFANHPAKGTDPNVMVCPYDFPLTENDVRVYIPNVLFGKAGDVNMKRFGSFWFKSRGSGGDDGDDVPVLKTLVLVATRAICDEEVLLNYRLSNSKRRPTWYTPVDEEEDKRRWS